MNDWSIDDFSECKQHGTYVDNGEGCPVCNTQYTSLDGLIEDIKAHVGSPKKETLGYKVSETITQATTTYSSGLLTAVPDFAATSTPKKIYKPQTVDIIRFTIDGQPIPKERPRMSKYGKAYTPTKTKRYEAVVNETSLLAISTPFDIPVFVHLAFYRKGKKEADIDNLCKAVLDGMNKNAYTDDKLVRQLFASLTYQSKDPRVEVRVCPVDKVKISFSLE